MDKTEARLTLAIDAMGSDRGPEEILEGVAQAVEVSPRSTEFMLFGREEILSSFVEGNSVLSNARVSIRHAPEVVGMDEKPIAGIKGKKNSKLFFLSTIQAIFLFSKFFFNVFQYQFYFS